MRTFNIASAIGIISLITLLSASCDTGMDKNGTDRKMNDSTSNGTMGADTANSGYRMDNNAGRDTTGVR